MGLLVTILLLVLIICCFVWIFRNLR